MSETRCTCGAGHKTFGECMRAKNIQFADIVARAGNHAWDSELGSYADARRQGLQPASTKQSDIDYAWSVSNRRGAPFRADV